MNEDMLIEKITSFNSTESLVSLLNQMIALKRENNLLKREKTFLQNILQLNQLNNPLTLYVNTSFISDIQAKQHSLQEVLPDSNLETFYFINGNKGKKRRKNKRKKSKND